MKPETTKYPFEIPFSELQGNLDIYVSQIFSSLESEFLVLPRGPGFVDYPVFEQGYEALKQATAGFTNILPEPIMETAKNSADRSRGTVTPFRNWLGMFSKQQSKMRFHEREYLTGRPSALNVSQDLTKHRTLLSRTNSIPGW